MLRCGHCGTPVVATRMFCNRCGTRIDHRDTTQPPIEYAGFWRRAAAGLVDCVVMAFTHAVLTLAIMTMVSTWVKMFVDEHTSLMIVSGADLLSYLVIYWLYFALQESSPAQATVGKRVVGIRVTDLGQGRISFAHATGRCFSKIVSIILCMLGFVIAGFTQKKQALHDLMASTLVVVNRPG